MFSRYRSGTINIKERHYAPAFYRLNASGCRAGARSLRADEQQWFDPSAPASASQQTPSLPAEIKNKLTQDGFTGVTVVPGSFVVSAKDKHGDPVMMVIGPNSMTVLTAVKPQSQQSTTGSRTSPDSNSSSTGSSPMNNSPGGK